MKNIWIVLLFLSLLLCAVFVPQKVYVISPETRPQSVKWTNTPPRQGKPLYGQNLSLDGVPTDSQSLEILLVAHRYVKHDGMRPYWPYKPFKIGEPVPASEAADVVARLIACESQCRSIKIVDSNDFYSYGVLMNQSSTWAQFEKESGMTGNPMNPVDAIRIDTWAIEHGYLWKWSCASILKIVR